MSSAAPSSESPKSSVSTPRVLVPAERTTIFPLERAAALLQAVSFKKPEGITGYWTPTPRDLDGVESGLEEFLANEGQAPRLDWSPFRRQVAGLRFGDTRALFLSYFIPEPNAKPFEPGTGNASATEPPYWINDGGANYFRVIYDLNAKAFTWYERNREP